jgi:hypothetical protein
MLRRLPIPSGGAALLAVLQVVKHQIHRIFSPEVNQEADAWKFDYRVYHDCWVKAQKTNGIYVSHA